MKTTKTLTQIKHFARTHRRVTIEAAGIMIGVVIAFDVLSKLFNP